MSKSSFTINHFISPVIINVDFAEKDEWKGLVPKAMDTISDSDPEWGLDVKFHKSATVRYGPWVDQQRYYIQKYFFPSNFQELPVTKIVEPDELRVHSGFDVNVEFAKGTTFDMLFSKNDETSAIHICCGDVATFHYYQPWVVHEYGYSNNIVARFQQIEVSTSMSFQKLIECEVVEVIINMTIPRMWNCFQRLDCEVWFTKATCYYINEHKNFINDLFSDWSATEPPDIAKFIPYEWGFQFYIRDFELILLANQFNWIDCTNENENSELALCGETLDINFILSYINFLPDIVLSKFFFRGETVILRSFLPESNTLRQSVLSLSQSSDKNMYPKSKRPVSTDTRAAPDKTAETLIDLDDTEELDEIDQEEIDETLGVSSDEQLSKGWRRRSGDTEDWVDVWSVPVLILNLYYKYHPQHLQNGEIRMINQRCGLDFTNIDPTKLKSDVITVELEAGPSAVRLFGSFWRQFFIGIKNNYFGTYDDMHEFNAVKAKKDLKTTSVYTNRSSSSSSKEKNHKHDVCEKEEEEEVCKDMRQYRPFEANVTLVLLEIQAELSMHTTHKLPSPQAFSDRVTFEMHKTFKETRLQLIVSPVSIIAQDALRRPSDQSHLSKGFLSLSGLQFRGHAMFSDKEIPVGTTTVEYAWLVELQCGKLTGKITPLQLQTLLIWANTFFLHLMDEENVTENPDPIVKCPHTQDQLECTHIVKGNKLCPSEEVLKYKMFRLSLESVDVFVSEVECACNIQASPIRFSTCNSTSHDTIEGGSFFINEITIRQFVQQLNFGLDESPYPQYIPLHSNSWIEVGIIALGPITADIRELGKDTLQLCNQVKFLRLHDKETKRLWFLWTADKLKSKLAADRCKNRICACVGGCNFFDTNNNGVRFFTNQALDATNEKYTHYGSESLWGTRTDIGNSIRELIRKKSDCVSTSMSNVGSSGRGLHRNHRNNSSLRDKSSGTDTPDFFDRSSSVIQPARSSASKLACDRSRSGIGHTTSQTSLHKRTDSDDGTFYSCASEADLPNRTRSGKSGHKSYPANISMKSGGSSISYVSAVSTADLLEGDEVDGLFHGVGPLVRPGLLDAYSHYMQPITCINWRQNIPTNLRRKFNLLKNLKFICPIGSHGSLPNMPSFNPSVQGKLPFIIIPKKQDDTDRQAKLSNQSSVNNASPLEEGKEKKTFISVRLHKRVSLVLTPILLQALDRYISCLSSIDSNYPVLHALDSLHASCISQSKSQYIENNVVEHITNMTDEKDLQRNLMDIVPPSVVSFGLHLPEINVIFFQISSEMYTPSEQSSLSGQCGSEYSDCDAKNTGCILLAAKFSNLSFNFHQTFVNKNLFDSYVSLSQKTQSLQIADTFFNRCKNIITTPSIFSVDSELRQLQTQILYLEGGNDRQVNVTHIPTTEISFHVVGGGDINFDAVSILDSGKQDLLGKIIFEGGIEGINMNIVFQKRINGNIIKGNDETKKCKKTNNINNNNNDERDEEDLNENKTSNIKPEFTVVEIVDEEVKSTTKSETKSHTGNNDVTSNGDLHVHYDDNSSIGSFSSSNHVSSTRKGYIALDVDSGEFADTSDLDADDEHEEDEEVHVSISTSSPKTAVRFSKKTKKAKKLEDFKDKELEPVIIKDIKGHLNLESIWFNLAAPTHLRNIYHEEVQNLNLVTVIVPALSCWIPPIVDLLNSTDTCVMNYNLWMRSVLACFMGQGLPEVLVKKHNISCVVTDLSKFLQEEYSSQLVYVMRKQSDGHRLLSIKKSLKKTSYAPKPEDLLAGIHALARQWKCMIIGAEVPESTFQIAQGGNKKHVVGRGRLTEKDLNILMKSSEAQSTTSDNPSIISPVEVVISGDELLSPISEQEISESVSENHALLSSNLSGDESRKSRLELEMEQSLYHWMSKSPASTAINSPLKEMIPPSDQTDMLSGIEEKANTSLEKIDKHQQLENLRSTSPMVSVPTSGVQLAKAAVVFNSIFSVVGIKSGPTTPSQMLGNGSFCLEKVQVNLKNSVEEVADNKEDAAEIEVEKSLPAFLLESLKITVQAKGGREQCRNYSMTISHVDHVSNDVKFYMDVKQIHQHLDFKFVRLVLQLSETMRVVKEQKKFVQKNVEAVGDKCDDWEKEHAELSDGGIEEMPKSWRNMYNVMNLYRILHDEDYSAMDATSPSSPPSLLHRKSIFNKASSLKRSLSKEICGSSPKSTLILDVVPTLSLTGIATLRKGKLTASISGLDLDFEMNNLNGTYINSRKNVSVDGKESEGSELLSSASVHLDKLTICLLESIKGNGTMMTCRVVKSHALHTTLSKPSCKLSERSLLAIGPISVDIPQHPGALRSIVAQFTARLQIHYLEFDAYRLARSSGNDKIIEETSMGDIGSAKGSSLSTTTNSTFRVTCDVIHVSAALLPSLNVDYKIDKVTGWGSINGKVKFYAHLPSHVLSFDTKVQVVTLPTRSYIALPPIKVEGSYIEIHNDVTGLTPNSSIRGHCFLPVQVDIGPLVHNLSTDLLNHLIFLQKGFAKEVNQVVHDVDTNEPVPLWKTKSDEEMLSSQPMIYSVKLKVHSICITATTPSSTGVRLETGEVLFELSNQSPASSVLNSPHYPSSKMYGRANVYLSLSLGQFNKIHDQDQDLSVFANFHTSLGMRNSAHENNQTDNKETIFINLEKPQLFVMPAAVDKGVLVYLHYKNAYNQWVDQRSALSTDYSTFAEHILRRFPSRSSTDVASSYLFLQVYINNMGVGLPLKETTVLPTTTLAHGLGDIEPGTALLITIAETSITCCNSGSFVSTGLFKQFCIRFAENFDHTAENWCSDNSEDTSTNTYVIPEGSYEVCSRTINSHNEGPVGVILPGKWVMTFFWKMRGIDVNIDVNIGKRLNQLMNVLTAITGDSDVADLSSVADAEGGLDVEAESKFNYSGNNDNIFDVEDYDVVDGGGGMTESCNLEVPDTSNNLSPCSDTLQRQLSLHTRRVDQLRRSNASPEVINKEVKTLQEIETIYKNQFFKDVKKKFRRRSTRVRSVALKQRRSVSEMKRRSLHSPEPAWLGHNENDSDSNYANQHSFNQQQNDDYANNYDTVDAPRIPDTVIYNLTENIYGSNDVDTVKHKLFDNDIKSSCENIPSQRPSSHVKFSDSTYDVRSDGSGNVPQTQQLRSTALDFELNVVVDIDSGKCTFHTSDNVEPTKEEEFNTFVANRDIDRRHSDHEVKDKKVVQNMYHRPVRTTTSVNSDNTVILIPGVNARVHYLSTNMVDKATDGTFDADGTESSSMRSGSTKQQVKIADLNALILIQSISKEMVVRPSLLDFLEKALEPIMEASDQVTESTGSILSSSGSSLYSFPVNVSVLIRIDPSDIRFSCLPVSKVECLLRIPSLDFAITKTHAPYITPIVPSPKKKHSIMKDGSCSIQNPGSSASSDMDFLSGSSFTLCLSRFSFCIFHPYGAQYGSTSESRLTKGMFADQKKDPKRFSQPISGRKDSLSLNVEFVKFNLFRKTMKVPVDQVSVSTSSQEFRTEVGVSAICDIGSASFVYDMRRLNEILDVPKAWYKRGLVQRIFLGKEGSYATQSSLLQNNKTTYAGTSSREDSPFSVDRAASDLQLHNSLKPHQPSKKTPGLSSHRRAVSGGSSFFSSLMSPFPIPRSSTTGSRKDMFQYEPARVKSTSDFTYTTPMNDSHPEEESSYLSQSSTCNEWETNVVVAFKVSRIDVQTNMGNVMGQATWSTNDLTANCNVLMNNIGKRTKVFDVAIRQSSMEAHGGVIGIYAELHDIKALISLDEILGRIPQHSAILSMKNIEIRLDYMGSSIIMAMLSMLKLKMEDKWIVPNLAKSESESSINSMKPNVDSVTGNYKCEIQVICDAHWDELQLIISRSTTPDIVKIIAKLEDFFDQQHRNSVRALSTLRKLNRSPNYMSDSLPSPAMKEEKTDKKDNDNGLKYQHWMEILNGIYGVKFRNMVSAMPDKNIALGGKLCLRGNFVSLTCFHGVNFRSQNWGLFTLRGPCIEFTTHNKAFEKSCQVMRGQSSQNLTFTLGDTTPDSLSERRRSTSNLHDFMATVRKVSRGSRNPPSLGAHVQEWMMFVSTISENDIPTASSTNRQTANEKFSHTKVTSSIRKVSFAPKFRYENESEVIFALPRLSLILNTEHDLPMTRLISKILCKDEQAPLGFQLKPSNHTVDIRFISEYDDSLTVDVVLLIYLHDLILNYMKEKEASVTVSSSRPRGKSTDGSTPTPSDTPKKEATPTTSTPNATTAKKSDMMKRTDSIKKEEKYREFRTIEWRLEPKVSMLTWGSRMDPINIDWVLEKLGFMHAALTIPKWMQRGVLDPMDVVLAKLVAHVLAHMVEKEEDESNGYKNM